MEKEQKELLLKDLCARLPYGVKFPSVERSETVLFIDTSDNEVWINGTNINDFKPYLFPLSSITEEQMKELPFESSLLHALINGYIFLFEDEELTIDDIDKMLDWLNKNMFDWRGLIPIGLAIDATNLNIY